MTYEVLRKEVETLDEDGEKFMSEELLDKNGSFFEYVNLEVYGID